MKYKFKAKALKSEDFVEGDLAYAKAIYNGKLVIKPLIVTHGIHGGMMWVSERHFIDENTIQLITEED